MKICIFTEALKQGGVEKTVANLDKSLNGFEHQIVLYDKNDITYDISSPVHSLVLPIYPFKNIVQEIMTLFKGAVKLWCHKINSQIDVCISFKEHPNIVNILSMHSKSIVSVREYKSKGTKFKGLLGILVRSFIRIIYSRSDLIVAVSYCIASDLINNYGIDQDKIVVIYNGCDLENIKKLCCDDIDQKLPFAGPVVITVGRLSREKLHWQLIRSFSLVVKHFPEAGLVIVGAGDELGYLKKIVSSLGIDKNVYFTGFQKNPYKYLDKSDLFVLSSAWEGFPNVLIEAMACGLPVISVDCKSGPREILAPNMNEQDEIRSITYAEYGVLVPELDGKYKRVDEALSDKEIVMSEAIIKILQNKQVSIDYIEKGKQRVADFSMQNFSDNWLKIINSVFNES